MAAQLRTPIRRQRRPRTQILQGPRPCSIACTPMPRHATAAGTRCSHPPVRLLLRSSSSIPSSRACGASSRPANSTKCSACSVATVSHAAPSEAGFVFDPELLHAIIGDLATQSLPLVPRPEAEALRGLTAVDGSLLPALPKMAWRCAIHNTAPPRCTSSSTCSRRSLSKPPSRPATTRKPNNCGPNCELNDSMSSIAAMPTINCSKNIIAAQSDFIGRIRDNAVWHRRGSRPAHGRGPGGGRPQRPCRLAGRSAAASSSMQPVRVLEVDTGKTAPAASRTSCSCDQPPRPRCRTGRPGLPLSLDRGACFPLAQRILGCRHLLANSRNGVTIQVYLAIIASLLISVWVVAEPIRRTWRCSSSTSRAGGPEGIDGRSSPTSCLP